MRIVLDLQGAQTESRFRGIGRYSLALAKGIAKNINEHELWIILNGAFPATIEPIRKEFNGLLSQDRIKVFEIPLPVKEMEEENIQRTRAAEIKREAFIFELKPDFVLITSLFEGWVDDAVVSIKSFLPGLKTAVVLYDLIPLIYKEIIIDSAPKHFLDYYFNKINSLKKADLLLSISDSSKNEGLKYLKLSSENIINISGAVEENFHKKNISSKEKNSLLNQYHIIDPFILYVPGGFDWKKNFENLFKGFALLPLELRSTFQLVIPGKITEGDRIHLEKLSSSIGIKNRLLLLGYIPEEDLISLYNLSYLFIFPSLHEGFGLPVLEAMACGAPVIASKLTSIPEIIELPDALFDPYDPVDISKILYKALSDETFRNYLRENGLKQVKKFSWDNTAKIAIAAIEKKHNEYLSSFVRIKKIDVFSKKKLKILIIKLDHLGDLLLAIPAIIKLKKKYEGSELDIIVGSWNVDFAKKLRLFNNIYVYNFHKETSTSVPEIKEDEVNELINQLGEYDLAIDLRRQRDTRFLLSKIKANFKAGYQSHYEEIDRILNLSFPSELDIPYVIISHNKKSIALQMLDLVDALPKTNTEFLDEFPLLTSNTPKGLKIALFPKARNATKDWPINNYISLLLALIADERIDGINIYLAQGDASLINKFAFDKKIKINVNLPYDELFDSIAENRIAVSNNSFGAHISSYLGLEVIGIYGGVETVEEWSPVFGENTIITMDVQCSPCHIMDVSSCKNDFICLNKIDPIIVFKEIEKMIHKIVDSKIKKS